MQDVIDFLREEAEKCQQIAKVAEPAMVQSWLRSAELFERAANFIEARQNGSVEMEPTGPKMAPANGTTGPILSPGMSPNLSPRGPKIAKIC